MPVTRPTLVPAEKGVQYQREEFVEWFLEERGAVQHGWSIPARWSGDVRSDLWIGVEFEGAAVQIAEDGLAARLIDERASTIATYRGLAAWDAKGTVLRARIVPRCSGLAIQVSDQGAVYPITIDPWLSAPDWFFDLPTSPGAPLVGAAAGDLNSDGFGDFIVGAPTWNGTGVPAHDGVAWVFHGSASGLGSTPVATLFEPNFQGIAGTSYGSHAAALGDVDGDGFDDVAISDSGQSNPDQSEGAVYVYRGSSAGLVTTPFWTLEGGAQNALLRARFHTGDVNGDGRADLLTLANDDASQTGNTTVRLYLGSASSGSPTPVWSISRSGLGQVLVDAAGVGDVNGDGYEDIGVVGGPPAVQGSLFVFFGSPIGPASTTPDFVHHITFGLIGFVEPAGDYDGNGFADVLVGGSAGSWLFLSNPALNGPQSLPNIPMATTGSRIAGDADGDTIPDRLEDVGVGGGLHVYTGGPTTFGAPILFQATGPVATGLPGGAVTSAGAAGDVNGDGRGDVFCLDTSSARVTVLHGCPSPDLVPVAVGSPLVLQPSLPSSFGASCTASGDINGDGLSDLLVGAPNHSSGEVDEGAVHLFISSAAGYPSVPTWSFESNSVGALLGTSVSFAGDVDNDGYMDVLVGAPGYGNGQSAEGRAYLFRGTASGVLASSPAWTFESNDANAELGASVAAAGDTDGDGRADVILGAPGDRAGATDRGAAYVFLGRAAGALGSVPAVVLDGGQNSSRFGTSVSTAGDPNRDGFSDVLIGAPGWTSGQPGEGAAFLFLGSNSGPFATAAWVSEGGLGNAEFGTAVAAAGDVNSDGFSDVLIGAPGFAATTLGGAVFVHFGSPGAAPFTTTPQTVTLGTAGAGLGRALAHAGDVNNDGFSDALVGAPGLGSGQVLLYLGASSGLVTPPAMSWGNPGTSVCAGGDWNGDGFSDLVTAFPGSGAGGQVELYVGSSLYGSRSSHQQRRLDDTQAIMILGRSESTAGIRFQGAAENHFQFAGTTAGRERYRIEYELKPLQSDLNGTSLGHIPVVGFVDSGVPTLPANTLSLPIAGLSTLNSYAWRQRFNLAHPLFPRTTWRAPQGNGLREKKFGTALDCNGNGIADALDIQNATSLDCNGNTVPDECDVPPLGTFDADCNANLVPDNCEYTTLFDCDLNGVLDECQLPPFGNQDCNGNSVVDACDIASSASQDTNLDGIPDECQPGGTLYCFGDGTGTACPCGNTSPAGNQEGCLNSLGFGGRLRSSGVARVSADSFALLGSNMPNSSALYFQGTAQQSGGNGAIFGDGKRCAAGSVIRLGTKINAGNASQYPVTGDQTISVRGALPTGGGTRYYQVWYRNAAAFCTVSTFNLTNGLHTTWLP